MGLGKAAYWVFVLFYTLLLTLAAFPVFITSLAIGCVHWVELHPHRSTVKDPMEHRYSKVKPMRELLLPGLVLATRVEILTLLWMVSYFVVGDRWRQEGDHWQLLGSPLWHWAVLASVLLLFTPIVIPFAYFLTKIPRSDTQHIHQVYWIRGVEASLRRVLYFGLILVIWCTYFVVDYDKLRHANRQVHKYIILTLAAVLAGVIIGLLNDIVVLLWMSKYIFTPDHRKKILFSAYELLLKDKLLNPDDTLLIHNLILNDPLLIIDVLDKQPSLIHEDRENHDNLLKHDPFLFKELLFKEPLLFNVPKFRIFLQKYNKDIEELLKHANFLCNKDTIPPEDVLPIQELLFKDLLSKLTPPPPHLSDLHDFLLHKPLLIKKLISNEVVKHILFQKFIRDLHDKNPTFIRDLEDTDTSLSEELKKQYPDIFKDPPKHIYLQQKHNPKDCIIDSVFSLQDINEVAEWLIIGVRDHSHFTRQQTTRPVFPLFLNSFLEEMAKLQEEYPYPKVDDKQKMKEERHKRSKELPSKLKAEFKLKEILSTILMAIQFLSAFVVWLFITGLGTATVVVTFGSLFVGVTFIFADTCKQFFQCCVFSFLTDPFDVGDIVWIDDKKDELLKVKTISVMLTTFIKFPTKDSDDYDEIVVYPNSMLATLKIVRRRRKKASKPESKSASTLESSQNNTKLKSTFA